MTSQTVSQVIEDAVREALRPGPPVAALNSALPIFGGGGILPGVDLSTADALVDRMDSEEAIDALR